MDKGLILRDTCRRSGLMMAILLTISAALTMITSGVIGAVLPVLICVGAWMAAFGKTAGAGMVKVVLTIQRIFMYVILGVLAVSAAIVIINSFRVGLMDLVLPVIIALAVALCILIFYAKLFRNAAELAGDLKYRLSTDNQSGIILMPDQISLHKFVITILVFQSIGLAMTLAASSGVMGFVMGFVGDFARGFADGIGGMGGELASALTSGMFGAGLLNIVSGIFNIVLSACSIAFISQYKRVITA